MPVDLRPLPPKDAIAFFRSKGLAFSFDYRDVWDQQHAQAFTVAKAMSIDILEDIRSALDQAMVDGLPFEAFQKQLTPILQAKGWWGRKEMVDPATGQTVLAQLGSRRRLRTIFDTNMRQAYNAGNWQRSWKIRADLPYLLYHHNPVRFPDPHHVAWDGVVLPIVHPWWKSHYPQCRWGCKCSTESLSDRMLRERGLKVTADADIPTFPKVTYTNTRTGAVSEVERGIDPAFNFNIGAAPLRPITAAPAPSEPLRDGAKPYVEAGAKAFLDQFDAGAAGKIVSDRDGWPLALGPELFRDAAGGVATPRPNLVPDLGKAAQAIKAPDRIDWRWAGANPVLDKPQAAALDRVLAEVGTSGNASGSTLLTPVEPWLSRLAQDNGVMINGYVNSTDGSTMRHMFKSHGDPAVEAPRGQIAIVAADVRNIPAIVASPDIVIFGMMDDRGFPAIGFVQSRPDGVVAYVATIQTRARELLTKTLLKRPAGADADALARDLVLTSKTGRGLTPKIIPLTGAVKTAARRARLVRRYTKLIDKLIVTVDFSDGAWTYDVREAPPAP